MSNTAEELEHAEHVKHASHSPFDRKVAMTMSIVAACLALMTMLSHRSHTATLHSQGLATDTWNEFQAKNIRKHEYEADKLLLAALSSAPELSEARQKAIAEWEDKLKKYKTELPALEAKARAYEHEAHENHKLSDRFDLGELGTELSLVLCSLAVLTKRAPFWYAGATIGALGMCVGLSAFLIPYLEGQGHASAAHSAPANDKHAPESTDKATSGSPDQHGSGH
jgi:hypothetical protein